MYNYTKLHGRIVECYRTQHRFAREIGLTPRSISLKLNNVVGWKQSEIAKAAKLLDLSNNEIGVYFFTRVKTEN